MKQLEFIVNAKFPYALLAYRQSSGQVEIIESVKQSAKNARV